jgi:hypothetical protein
VSQKSGKSSKSSSSSSSSGTSNKTLSVGPLSYSTGHTAFIGPMPPGGIPLPPNPFDLLQGMFPIPPNPPPLPRLQINTPANKNFYALLPKQQYTNDPIMPLMNFTTTWYVFSKLFTPISKITQNTLFSFLSKYRYIPGLSIILGEKNFLITFSLIVMLIKSIMIRLGTESSSTQLSYYVLTYVPKPNGDNRTDHQARTELKHTDAEYYATLVRSNDIPSNFLFKLLGLTRTTDFLYAKLNNAILITLATYFKTQHPTQYQNKINKMILFIFNTKFQNLPIEFLYQISSSDVLQLNASDHEIWQKINRSAGSTFSVNVDKRDTLDLNVGTHNATLATFVLHKSLMSDSVFRQRPSGITIDASQSAIESKKSVFQEYHQSKLMRSLLN